MTLEVSVKYIIFTTYFCAEQLIAPAHMISIASSPVAGFDTDLQES